MYKRNNLIIYLFLVYFVGIVFYWFHIGGSNNIFRDYYYLLTPLIATICGVFAVWTYGLKGSRAKTVFFLFTGVANLFLGECIYDYYIYFTNSSPFPSVADFFFLISYPFFFIGLYNEIKTSRINWGKLNPAVSFLIGLLTFALLALVGYFGVFLAYDAKETLFTNAIAIAYGLGDMVLVFITILVLVVVWEFREGTLSRAWVGMVFGFVATLIADILFAIFNTQYVNSISYYKEAIDSFYMLGYLLFAYGFLEFGLAIREVHASLKKRGSKKKKNLQK